VVIPRDWPRQVWIINVAFYSPIGHDNILLLHYFNHESGAVGGHVGRIHRLQGSRSDAIDSGLSRLEPIAQDVLPVGKPAEEEVGEGIALFRQDSLGQVRSNR
jgi:hypothetical protein